MNFYSQDAHRFFQLKLAEAFKEKIIGLINEGLINEAWMHFLHFFDTHYKTYYMRKS